MKYEISRDAGKKREMAKQEEDRRRQESRKGLNYAKTITTY